MTTLKEKVLTGKWKSFKVFKRLGQILLHNKSSFREFEFTYDRKLTITNHEANKIQKELQTDQWTVTFDKKKHFLSIPSYKVLYEIITVNHTVMVLLEIASGEKIFFAKDQHWEVYLKANQSIVF
jgi:hypothetical protein